MKSFITKLDMNFERWLCLIFYSMIVATIVSEIIRRFAFSYSSSWGEEVARYSFIYLAWLGAALAVKNRSHIRIDVILNMLPNRGKTIMYILSDFFTLILACVALWVSIDPVLTSIKYESVTHGLRIGQYWFFAAVPFGFSVIVLRLIQSMKRDISDLIANRDVFEGDSIID